jgi:DNA-binding HxlR family transcriptional regulator
MVKRKSLDGNACAIARSLNIIGDWWSLLIIRDAMSGITRFGEFQRSLGLAKNILAVRLKAMMEQDILTLTPASDGSAYQDYILTEKGRALLPVLVALGQWGAEYLYQADEAGNVPLDARKKRPLRKLELRAEDGRKLTQDDVFLVRNELADA